MSGRHLVEGVFRAVRGGGEPTQQDDTGGEASVEPVQRNEIRMGCKHVARARAGEKPVWSGCVVAIPSVPRNDQRVTNSLHRKFR